MSEVYYFDCPHCGDKIQIAEQDFNCRIFRHAVFKSNGQQINPHAPQTECERLSKSDLIWGCGRPFRIVGPAYKVEKCDYI